MAQRQFFPPTSFNRSPLVQLLASLEVTPVADSTQSLAEKLGHWVAWTDAVSLSAALGHSEPVNAAGSVPQGPPAMVQQFQRVRRELTESIVNDRMFAARPGPVGDKPPASPVDAKAEFALCRRQYLAHQRTMEDRVGALRAQVRMAASAASAPLRQLAALDNVLDNALGSHQRRLLANVPHLLETRFKTLTGAARAEVAPQPGSPAADPHAETGGMGRLLQELLLAELEIRLQPIEGMMEALGNKPDGQS